MPAPVYDNATSAGAAGGTGLTVNHTVGAGTSRVLVAGGFVRGNFGSFANPTWNGSSSVVHTLTTSVAQSNLTALLHYVLSSDLSSGAADFVWTSSNPTRKVGFVYSFTGLVGTTAPFVDQSGAHFVSQTGQSTAPSTTLVGNTNGTAIDFVAHENQNLTLTAGAGQTAGTQQGSGAGSGIQGNQSREAGASSVTMSWQISTAPGDDWVAMSLMLRGVAANPTFLTITRE